MQLVNRYATGVSVGVPPTAPTRGLVFLASRRIEPGGEVHFNYRLSRTQSAPEWYAHVPEELVWRVVDEANEAEEKAARGAEEKAAQGAAEKEKEREGKQEEEEKEGREKSRRCRADRNRHGDWGGTGSLQ
jgi:hypothetical protein